MVAPAPTPSTLGATLASARSMRGASLKTVAEPAGISASYLQKLERDQVNEPSPRILQRLAQQLSVPYGSLMELAGYVLPREAEAGSNGQVQRGGALSYALSSQDVTEEEAAALGDYLNMLRQREKRRSSAG